jgi:hypothetical protein
LKATSKIFFRSLAAVAKEESRRLQKFEHQVEQKLNQEIKFYFHLNKKINFFSEEKNPGSRFVNLVANILMGDSTALQRRWHPSFGNTPLQN